MTGRTAPAPQDVFRGLREYLSVQVAHELHGEPGGSKAVWLLEWLHLVEPRSTMKKRKENG